MSANQRCPMTSIEDIRAAWREADNRRIATEQDRERTRRRQRLLMRAAIAAQSLAIVALSVALIARGGS